MASTFAGLSLFNSGPHRFAMGGLGRLLIGPLRSPTFEDHTTDAGAPLEVRVMQRGRLIAATPAALWTLVDAIKTHAELPRTGTLVDHHGRSWTSMTLIRFEPTGPMDRGRTCSIPYVAEYLRFGT